MTSFDRDLGALRDGALSFDRFAHRHRARFARWAQHFFSRWPQRALDVDDLHQEALLEAWRAVDEWDPAKGVALRRFVEYRVGRKLRVELERVLGWPKKSRGQAAVRPMSIDASPKVATAVEFARRHEAEAEERAALRQVVDEETDPLTAQVLAGVGLGMGASAVAAHLWADPEARLAHRFDSQAEARRRVRRVIKAEVSRRQDTCAQT